MRYITGTLLALTLFCVAARTTADDETLTTFGETTRVTVTLPGGLGEERAIRLTLGFQDGRCTQSWAQRPGRFRIVDAIDADELKLEGKTVQGTLSLWGHHFEDAAGWVAEYSLRLAVDGEKVTGDYKGWWATRSDDVEYTTDSLIVAPQEVRWKRGRKQEVSGSATGRKWAEAQLRRGYELAKGQDWPAYGGPRGDFSAAPYEAPLVDDLRNATLVWRGEDIPPSRCQVARYGEGNVKRFFERGGPAGGGCSPMVADGRVYLSYFKPTGEQYAKGTVQGLKNRKSRTLLDLWRINAVDVILCMDAATGKTLWKLEIPGGRYLAMNGRQGSTKGWYSTNIAHANGRIYAGTTSDVTYCLDAKTGEIIWKRRLGPASARIVVDGVLIPSGRHLTAYDAATGKKLWQIEEVNSDSRAPFRWEAPDGRTYVIAANKVGTVVCVEPKTGKERWRLTDTGDNSNHILVADGHLILNGQPDLKRNPGRLTAWRISPDGAEKAWELPVKYHYDPYRKYPLAFKGKLYHQIGHVKGQKIIDGQRLLGSRMVCIDISTGKVLAETPGKTGEGMVYQVGRKLFLQTDSSHSKTPLLPYSTSPADFGPLADVWHTRHKTTSSYWPVLQSQAFADGRVFIRGAEGIFCYDLRRARKPVFDPPGKKTSQPVSLKLSHPDPDATIRYAFDGNEPTADSPVYTKPLKIAETRIVKARAWHPTHAPSAATRAVIYFGKADKAQPPHIHPKPGTYEHDLTVKLTSPTKYATIHYTLDGSPPTRKSARYEKPFVLAKSATLKAKTFCSYLPDSDTVEAEYDLQRRPFLETDGQIVIEAESFFTQKQAINHQWKIVDSKGASGKVIDATPDSGKKYRLRKGPRLDYPLLIDKAGSFYIWVRWRGRSSSSDSLYVGFNRNAAGEFGNHSGPLRWQRLGGENPKAVKVLQAGQNTFHIWMREDGSVVDKVVLTRDADWAPQGDGPDESPRRKSD